MKHRLYKGFVEGLTEPGKVRDTEVKGFAVKVTPAGKKVYIVENSVRGGSKKVTVTIGPHGLWTTDNARKEAKEILALMAKGINPNQEKERALEKRQQQIAQEEAKKKQSEITLKVVLEDYLKSRGESLKESTRYIYRIVVASSLADWMDKPIESISREMVEARHREITQSGKKGAANHVMRILRALFTYAMTTYTRFDGEKLLPENPVKRLSEVKAWNKLHRRQGVIKTHELQAWYQAVQKLHHEIGRDLLVFLLFTGLRRNEAAGLKWSDIDFDAETIFVEDTKNRQPHMLPMTQPLRQILERRRRVRCNELVFPSKRTKGQVRDLRSDLDKIAEETGIEFTVHDLRRTFITIAESLDIPYYAIKRLANHKDSSDVTVGYIVADVERVREPMQKISDFIESKIHPDKKVAAPAAGKTDSKVVPIRRKATR